MLLSATALMRAGAASALLLALAIPSASRAEQPGEIVEFPLNWPSQAHNSTHELASDSAHHVFWVTGQDQDQVARVSLDGMVRPIAMPTGSGPHGMDFDGQGRLWVSLEFAGLIVRLDDDGKIVQSIDIHIPAAGGKTPVNPSPHAIAFGPDGKTIWFTGKHTATIGKISPDGKVEHFPLGTAGAVPIYLAAGPDGNMWGTELVGNKIFRALPNGTVTEFPIPTAQSRPIAIVPGPDGKSMWFSEEAGGKIARIAPDGRIAEYPVPRLGGHALLAAIAFDRDGNAWTQMYAAPPNRAGDRDYIVKLDKSLTAAAAGDISRVPITYYRVPSHDTIMHRIKEGPDGNIWFTELQGDRIGRLSTGAGTGQ